MTEKVEDRIKREIREAIASYEKDILGFTQELVAIPSENPPGASYAQCVEVIRNKLSEIGLHHEVVEVPGNKDDSGEQRFPRYCILGSHGTGTRTLYFHGHYDVVPASSSDQFHPYFERGCIFGRGSSDMKSGLAAMIYAVKAIKEAEIGLDGRIGLTIVPDEETGGRLGSQYLLNAGILGKNGIGMLIPEPTSGAVWNANRGAISVRITVNGKPAHVGLQHQGVNAFEKMLPIANALLELKREVESRATRYTLDPGPARNSILMMGGHVKGGNSFNLVPGEISFTVDRRINPEEDLEVERRRLFEIIDRFREDEIDLRIETLQEGASSGVQEDHALAQALARNIEIITGHRPRFEMCPGLLEIRFYVKQGIPALAYGPGLLSVSHGPQEHVRAEDILNCAAIYAMTGVEILTEGLP